MSTTEKRAKAFFDSYIREKDFVPKSEREMTEMLAAYEESFKKTLVVHLAAYEHIINGI
jgi:hypothetical protein